MNGWTVLRLLAVALAGAQGARDPAGWMPAQGVGAGLLFGLLGYGLIAVPVVASLQRFNRRAPAVWRYPSWSINPLTMREPLQFFHAAGFVFLGIGAGIILGELAGRHPLTLASAPTIAIGLGLLGGVYASTLIFRSRMQPRETAPG
jgi:hypothetical protein